MKLKKYKSVICIIAAVCLLGAAVFCGYHIYHHNAQVDEQAKAFDELAEVVENAPDEEEKQTDEPVSEGEDILAKYRELYLQNEDMVGWISIAGTTINYPVMQTKNNPNFYLKRNFEKEYSDLGVPYIQENCDIATSDNLIIYGHHITGGRMFGALEDYKSQSFYEEHKTIQFDTLTEQAEYEIIAVFKTVAYSAQGYRYYDFVDAENEEEFDAFVGKCKELVYICSPYSGDTENNIKKARDFCRYALDQGQIPLAPHLMFIGHGICHIIAETSVDIQKDVVREIVHRITGDDTFVDYMEVPQDLHLAKNQEEQIRCGDNGIFKGMPVTEEQKALTDIAAFLYKTYSSDGKYIMDEARLIICQSNAETQHLKELYPDAEINPLGDWSGGTMVDAGATNRKLGSDMADSVTGGGLHGKDLSKADVSVNIYAWLKAQETGKPVELCCAIGDTEIDGVPYAEIVEVAKRYILSLGGFERFAEWGLVRNEDYK